MKNEQELAKDLETTMEEIIDSTIKLPYSKQIDNFNKTINIMEESQEHIPIIY